MKYQQGDVVLIKVTKEEYNSHISNANTITNKKTIQEGRHELAYGEETGHCHAIYFDELLDSAGVTVHKRQWTSDDTPAIGVIVTCDDAVIKHEEHNPVALPKGYYIQRIVKEYDPISGQVRGVLD